MFERYTEKARRVIFFSRYEASQFGAQAIQAEHILLGFLREDHMLSACVFGNARSAAEAIRKEIEAAHGMHEKISASVDLPLSLSAKRVLSLAADESEKLGHRHIGTEHLLLGLLKETDSLASRALIARGVTEEKIAACINQQLQPTAEGETGGIVGEVSSSHIDPLITILAGRGLVTRQEFKEAFSERHGSAGLKAAFDLLIEMLVSKGVISEDDKRKINDAGQQE
jgi:ATP-dependent Clp protease ATP-binding subunit ClpA